MSKIDIFLLDTSNNTKIEVNMIKPKTYQKLLEKLREKIIMLPDYYEIFIIGKNNEEIIIYNEDKYKIIEDVLFIREIDKSILDKSLFELNYNKLSESQQDILDEKYSCILCSIIIKNEKPYLCYICQKLFHDKCLNDWDKKCKAENKILFCPNCRNELPKEKWNKKLDYEDNRKDNANLMNRINEYKLNKNINTKLNIIKDKKINELKDNKLKQYELIKKYENYIQKTITLFKNIIYKLNSIHSLLNLNVNKELNKLVNLFPLNMQNLEIDTISKVINIELDKFQNYLKHNNNKNYTIEKKELIILNLSENNEKLNSLNKEQINLLKIIINFYKQNECPQMYLENKIQMENLIKFLFNNNSEFKDKTEEFNYITSEKKRIKFILNSNERFLMKLPNFFTNNELYTIAERYKYFRTTNFILIHNNKILNKEESSINQITNNDIIYVIENRLYPDDSYFINLKNIYSDNNINDIINVIVSLNDYNEKYNFQISKHVTIKELITAIVEKHGLSLGDSSFTFNSRIVEPNDMRKIKEITSSSILRIECNIKFKIAWYPPLGKNINGKNKEFMINIQTGIFAPIKSLFDMVKNIIYIEPKKINIGNIELKPESNNYLSFYGIENDFEFTFEY